MLSAASHELLRSQIKQKSPANAKGNAQRRCMFESPVQTKFKLTHLSNDVSFTLARERQTT